MVSVAYHADVNEVLGDAKTAALLDAHAASVPFDRSEWIALQARCADQARTIAVASCGDARAVLALVGTGHLRSLANWYNFTARPLTSGGDAGEQALTALARDLKRRAWRITLAPLPDEDGCASQTERAFAAAGWKTRREQCDVNHILEVAGRSFAEYFAARPGPLRTTFKRKSGKVSVRLLQHFSPRVWDEYEAVYAASWKPEEGNPTMLREFAEQEGKAGRLRMAVAHADGNPVAAQFWTVEGGTAFIHKLAHREDARALSPGTTLSAALFEQVIDRDKVALVDFGTGDDAYKRDWMEAVRPRFRLDCLNPAAPRAWPHLVRRALAG